VIQTGLGFLDMENTTQSYGSSSNSTLSDPANSSNQAKTITTVNSGTLELGATSFAMDSNQIGASFETKSAPVATESSRAIRSKSTDAILTTKTGNEKRNQKVLVAGDSIAIDVQSTGNHELTNTAVNLDEIQLALTKHSVPL
jgi:hypothetical protein